MHSKLVYLCFGCKYQEFLIFLPTSADLISLPVVASTIWVSALNTASATSIPIWFFVFVGFFLSTNNINTR